MAGAKRSQQVIEEEPVDQTDETVTVTEPDAEGIPEPVAEALAKRMGWKPREEWTRDPEKWTPASQFLEGTASQVEDLRARNLKLQEEKERVARATAEMLEAERVRIREEALRTIRTAEDPEERAKAANRLAENAGPPPETRAWLARNPWFETDPDAQALASATVNRLAQRGASIVDQLAEAESVVKKRFPEYFATGDEQRLSDVRRQAPTPPQVQQGSRATTSAAPREKGFSDIPPADRQAFRVHMLKAFMASGQTQEQAEARYAKSYWREGVLPPDQREEDPWVREKKSNPWGRR